ncbi:MAG: SHOCT domain-containing protein [Desulfobacteraceae bacterium]|nr:SHOCT domain-containing protein [Desulfobacteraceae bacterium]
MWNMMHWVDNCGYGMGFGWISMLLFWGAVIYLIVALVKKIGSSDKESAEAILKKRYARGEISNEEFERLRKEMICKESGR